MRVSEKFHSIQGEGKSMGVPAFFVRLKSCNLLCGGVGTDKDGLLHDGATWRCDSIEVWLQGKEEKVEDIVNEFLAMPDNTHLIITGGEPLLQQREIIKLVEMLPSNRIIEIETNGTIMPDPFLWGRVQWNVSPKLNNSGMPAHKRIHEDVIRRLAKLDSQFKFVIANETDLKEVWLSYVFAMDLAMSQVWLMPAADDRQSLNEVSQVVIDLAKKYSVNFSNRLHIQLWNKKTGV